MITIEDVNLHGDRYTLLMDENKATYQDNRAIVLGYVTCDVMTSDREVSAWDSNRAIFDTRTVTEDEYCDVDDDDMAAFFLQHILDLHSDYQIIVGNIGNVHCPHGRDMAMAEYQSWVELSKSDYGRSAGEPVTLFDRGEIVAEYEGTLAEAS